MIKHKHFLFVVFNFFYITTHAQNFYKVDSIINSQIQQKNIAGAVAYVFYNNTVLHHKAYGFADISNAITMQQNSIFRIASQTKAIISIAVLQLVEKNKIKLDDPIENYFPSFAHQKVAVIEKDSIKLIDKTKSITIRNLLTHTSGISSAEEYPTFKPLFEKYKLNQALNNGYKSLQQEIEQIAAMPLLHQPGERFSYGLSTNVLGGLIELISGLNLQQYLTKNIFEPLAMNDTYFYLPSNKKSRLVKAYYKMNKDSLTEINTTLFPINYPLQNNSSYYSAIGGLVSTTHDYAQFLQCLLNNGKTKFGKQIISTTLLQEFCTNQLGDKTFIFGGKKSLNNFGLGVGLTTKAGQMNNNASVGSFFWGGAFNTAYMVDKKRNLITLFYFQRYPFVLPPILSLLEKTTIEIIDNTINQKK